MARNLKTPESGPPSSHIKLDWRAYFLQFCRVHGEPVNYRGRLLFRDGWMYSSSDYAGPEYSPPEDFKELDILCTSYWLIRQSELGKKLQKLTHQKQSLSTLQADHHLPLQQTVWVSEEEVTRRSVKDIDLSQLQAKIDWYTQDLEECTLRLKELEEYAKVDTQHLNGASSTDVGDSHGTSASPKV